MKHFAVYDKRTGEIVNLGQCQDQLLALQAPDRNHGVFEGKAEFSDKIDPVTKKRIIGGNPLPSKEPPTMAHVLVGREWVPDYAVLRKIKKNEIHTERNNRVYEMIIVDGTAIDADERSQIALGQKLTELNDPAATQPYPELLRWRAANNQMREFANAGQMRLWLQSAVQALARRRSEAYAWSWQRKAALAATPDDQLESFVP